MARCSLGAEELARKAPAGIKMALISLLCRTETIFAWRRDVAERRNPLCKRGRLAYMPMLSALGRGQFRARQTDWLGNPES